MSHEHEKLVWLRRALLASSIGLFLPALGACGEDSTTPIEEEPDSAPAASPCLRRRPSARPPQGRASPTREVPQQTCWGRATPGPDPPGSSRYSVERLYNISSSRTPLDPCSPGLRHLAVLTHPGFVGAAPTLTDTSRLRLPPASTGCCDSPQVQVSHLHSNSSASRRRKPALNAFATTFADRWPAGETY